MTLPAPPSWCPFLSAPPSVRWLDRRRATLTLRARVVSALFIAWGLLLGRRTDASLSPSVVPLGTAVLRGAWAYRERRRGTVLTRPRAGVDGRVGAVVKTSVVTERDIGEYGFACCWCGRQFVVGARYVRVPLGGTVGVYEAVCVPCVAATGERVPDPRDDQGGPECT